ncbi:MAG: hypothetical protein ACLTG0_02680 [Oscillibacter sp.]
MSPPAPILQVIEVMKTYCFASNTELFVVPAKDGKTDLDALKEALGDDAACFYLQQPNYFGQIETRRRPVRSSTPRAQSSSWA